MKQRINLLPPRAKVKRDFLRFNYVLLGIIGVLFISAVLTGLAWYDAQGKDDRLQAMLVEAQQQELELQQLTIRQAQLKPDTELAAYRDQLKQTVLSKQRLSGLLETVQPEYHQGFSEGLLAFSNSTPDKVWLTAFKMTSGSLILDLSGGSTDASQIPLFLRKLAQQAFFKRIHFAELGTEKKDDKAYLFHAHGVIAGGSHD